MERVDRGKAFARRMYTPRIIGTVLCAPIIISVLRFHAVNDWLWILLAANVVAWPNIARFISLHSKDPFKVEKTNLLVDSLFCGAWIGVMGLNPIASTSIFSMVTMNNITVGGTKLFVRGLFCQLAGLALYHTGFGVVFEESQMSQVWSCLPLLILYPMTVGWTSHHLTNELYRTKDQLRRLSITDGLTGLINRRHWDELLTHIALDSKSRHKTFLAVIDIDHFKTINDTYGHAVGDSTLRTVSKILISTLRSSDLISRFGGDEFCVMMTDSTQEQSLLAIERIKKELARESQDRLGFPMSISVGLSGWRDDFDDASLWFSHADALLYRAKRNGRDRIEIDDEPEYRRSSENEPKNMTLN